MFSCEKKEEHDAQDGTRLDGFALFFPRSGVAAPGSFQSGAAAMNDASASGDICPHNGGPAPSHQPSPRITSLTGYRSVSLLRVLVSGSTLVQDSAPDQLLVLADSDHVTSLGSNSSAATLSLSSASKPTAKKKRRDEVVGSKPTAVHWRAQEDSSRPLDVAVSTPNFQTLPSSDQREDKLCWCVC